MTSRTTAGLAAAGLVLSLAGCSPAASSPLGSAQDATGRLGAHNDTSTPFNLVSVPALTRHRYDGRDLRLGRVLAHGSASRATR